MIKRGIIIFSLIFLLLSNTAHALEAAGNVIFKDTLYGAAIGILVGGAVYLIDQDDLAEKFGYGLLFGTIGGLFFGVVETRHMVSIDDNKFTFSVPTPLVIKKDNNTAYVTPIFKVNF